MVEDWFGRVSGGKEQALKIQDEPGNRLLKSQPGNVVLFEATVGERHLLEAKQA